MPDWMRLYLWFGLVIAIYTTSAVYGSFKVQQPTQPKSLLWYLILLIVCWVIWPALVLGVVVVSHCMKPTKIKEQLDKFEGSSNSSPATTQTDEDKK